MAFYETNVAEERRDATNSGATTPHMPVTPRRTGAQQTPKKLHFSTPVHTVPPSPTVSVPLGSPKVILTNRKREEAIVMANLRKKVPECELTPRRRPRQPPPPAGEGGTDNGQHQLDNRPKIISLRAVTDNNNNNCDDSASFKASCTAIQDKDFILELLCWHNEYRARHGVTALTISPELCEYAQTFANHLADRNEFYYRAGKTLGQNLFCCPVSALVSDLTGQEVASFWYSTVRKYNYYKDAQLLHTNVNAGHFAQMIWASTKFLGVGKASSKTGKIFVVAFYFPPGNLVGAYHTNVLPPLDVEQQQQQQQQENKALLDAENNPIVSILKQ